jgi:hypothetical protein
VAIDHLIGGALKVEKLKTRKADNFTFVTNDELKSLIKELIKIGKPLAKKEKANDIRDEKRYALEEKKLAKKQLMDAVKLAKTTMLPKGVKASDLVQDYNDTPTKAQRASVDLDRISVGGYNAFNMYLVKEWGWCVPTLMIAHASRGSGYTDRAYAVRVSTGKVVRVGNGPHVEKNVTVYVKKSNFARLKPLFELMHSGAVVANETRDHISTRMMNRRRYW